MFACIHNLLLDFCVQACICLQDFVYCVLYWRLFSDFMIKYSVR